MEGLKIRRVRVEDAEDIAAIYAPFVSDSVISFEAAAPSADEMRKRIREVGPIYPWLVAADQERIAGYVYASPHSARAAYQWSANVTVYLGEGYRARGLGTLLYRRLFALLRLQNFRSLFAGVTLPNDASLALHKKMGMKDVGIYRNVGFKFGAWRDVMWLGRSFDDDRAPDAPPTPFDMLPADQIDVVLNTPPQNDSRLP